MTLEKPKTVTHRTSNPRRGGSSTREDIPLDTMRYEDGRALTEDAAAPAKPDFAAFAGSKNPVEQLLYQASQEPMTVEREHRIDHSTRVRGRPGFESHNRWQQETHTKADVAWHAGGSALTELMGMRRDAQERMLAPDGASDMVLRHPQSVLESARKVEQQGTKMFDSQLVREAKNIGSQMSGLFSNLANGGAAKDAGAELAMGRQSKPRGLG